MDTAVFLAVLAVFSTMVVGLFKIIDTQNKAQALLAENLKENTESNRLIALETKELRLETRDGNDKAEGRNGHLGSLSLKVAKLVTKQNLDVKDIRETNKKIVDLLKKGKDQHVETQIVDVQTVNNKE